MGGGPPLVLRMPPVPSRPCCHRSIGKSYFAGLRDDLTYPWCWKSSMHFSSRSAAAVAVREHEPSSMSTWRVPNGTCLSVPRGLLVIDVEIVKLRAEIVVYESDVFATEVISITADDAPAELEAF